MIVLFLLILLYLVKIYRVILVASDGIQAETQSDPQMITTLTKGMFY